MAGRFRLPTDLAVAFSLLLASAACNAVNPTTTSIPTPTELETPSDGETSRPTATIEPAGVAPTAVILPTLTTTATVEPTPTATIEPARLAPTGVLLPTPTPTDDLRVFAWPEEIAVAPGDELQIAIWVSPGNTGLSGGDIQLFFPAEVFDALDIQPGTLLGDDPLIGNSEVDNTNGVMRMAIARVGLTIVPTPQDVFTTFRLRVGAGAPAGQYRLDLGAELADQHFEDVPLDPIQWVLVTVQVP